VSKTIGRREFLRVSGVGLVALAAASCTAEPEVIEKVVKETVEVVKEVEKEVTVVVEKEAEKAQEEADASARYSERPEFAKLVSEGKLPPVGERLPLNPEVYTTGEIGQYGGEFLSVDNPFSHTFEVYAFRVNNEVTEFTPEYAEGYDWNEDYTVYTLRLRQGLKWSDGMPFTSEAFTFWYEHYHKNEDVSPAGVPGWMRVAGQPMEVTALDDYTVQYKFAGPYRPWANAMSNYNSLQSILHDCPHYMKKWHIAFNPDADKLAKEEGFDTWAQAFISHRNDAFRNGVSEAPTITPWLPVTWSTSTRSWEANPYYFAVDAAGNQLPYFWKVTATQGADAEVKVAMALSGDIHWLPNQPMNDINVFRDGAEQGDYRVILLRNSLGTQCGIGFNQLCKDPVKQQLFQDVRWRQAMSLCINRQEINELVHFGTATAQQLTLKPSVSFYKPEWATAHADYDPDRANELLDELGMVWDAEHEYRLGPDGNEFVLNFDRIDSPNIIPIQETELLREYFEDVGIRTVLKLHSSTLYAERRAANELEFGAWHCDRVEELRCFIPGVTKWNPLSETAWGRDWGTWNDTDGASGEEPPAKYKEQFALMKEWYSSTSDSAYKELGQKIWDFWAEDVTVFGTVAFPTAVFVMSNRIGNGPTDGMWFGDGMNWYKTFLPCSWYFRA